MPTLDALLAQRGAPGAETGNYDPALEEIVNRFGNGQQQPVTPPQALMGGGAPMQMASPGGQQMQMASPAGGVTQDGQNPLANMTYQTLVANGVPDQVAQAAIGNPQLLQQILKQLMIAKQKQLGTASQGVPQAGVGSGGQANPFGGGADAAASGLFPQV